MPKIFFVRHAETVYNIENRFCGRTDIPITENGKSTAKALGETKVFDREFDFYFVSPLRRTSETLQEMYPDKELYPIISSDITEIDLGSWEGKNKDSVDQELRKEFLLGNYTPPNGETHEDVYKRLKHFIHDISTRYPSNSSILVITHSGIIRTLKRMYNLDSKKTKTDNLEYIIIDI